MRPQLQGQPAASCCLVQKKSCPLAPTCLCREGQRDDESAGDNLGDIRGKGEGRPLRGMQAAELVLRVPLMGWGSGFRVLLRLILAC